MSPIWNIVLIAVVFCAGAILYRPALRALRRFDARNRARRQDEFESRFDPLAHYRETMRLAEEQVEKVLRIEAPDARTGVMLPRYVFLGEEYASEEEAEETRRAMVMAKARDFYAELDSLRLSGGFQHPLGRKKPRG